MMRTSPVVDVSRSPSRFEVWRMFDRIARHYDLLNRVLSFGRDRVWRLRLREVLPARNGLAVVDVATGTGDAVLTLLQDPRVERAVGVDLAGRMLARGRAKSAVREPSERPELTMGDGLALPFADESFDVATIVFGIRNLEDPLTSLREMARVLKPGGRAMVLEFSLPRGYLVRASYLVYSRHVLPLVGAIVSGDRSAYRYLNRTVETFPYGEAFCRLMEQVGFAGVTALPMTFGVATLYYGDKPGAHSPELHERKQMAS